MTKSTWSLEGYQLTLGSLGCVQPNEPQTTLHTSSANSSALHCHVTATKAHDFRGRTKELHWGFLLTEVSVHHSHENLGAGGATYIISSATSSRKLALGVVLLNISFTTLGGPCCSEEQGWFCTFRSRVKLPTHFQMASIQGGAHIYGTSSQEHHRINLNNIRSTCFLFDSPSQQKVSRGPRRVGKDFCFL